MEFPVRRILWRNVSRAFRLTTLKGTCLVSALIGHWLNLDGQASTSTTICNLTVSITPEYIPRTLSGSLLPGSSYSAPVVPGKRFGPEVTTRNR